MKSWILMAAVFLFSSAAFGQTPTAVTDAASFVNRVAPGALATVFGTDLSVGTIYAQPPLPLPLNLGGVQVAVNGIAAPLIYVSPKQINFQIPGATPLGTADLVVTVNGSASASLPFTVDSTSPGIFAYNATGVASDPTLLQVAAQNPPDYNNNNINSPSNAAAAGSVVVVYVGGVGQVQNPVDDGYPATGADPVLTSSFAMIGGEQAAISYLGLSPGSVGLGQANIQIPADLPSGNYPLIINIDGLQSISATISVSGSGTLNPYLRETKPFGGFEVSNRTTLQVLGPTLYLCGDVRVRVFDITNPGSPTFDGHYGEDQLNSSEISCTVNSNVSQPYLASVVGPPGAPTFTVFDLSQNPQAPYWIGAGVPMDEYTNPKRVVFDGNTGLVNTAWIDGSGNKHGDILAFDFTNPAAPVYLSTLQSDNDELKTFIRMEASHTLYAVTGTAYGSTIGGSGALDVIDTTDPTSLQLVTQVPVSGTALLQAFAVSGNTLLALGNTSDVTQTDFPSLTYQGDLTLTTMDVSNPLNPVVIATVDTGIQADGASRVVDLGQTGVFAVVYKSPYSDPGGPTTMAVVDATDPSQPVLYPQSTYYYYDGLASSNGYLFAADGNGMNVYQVTLP